MTHNPFMFGNPIRDPAQFFGRKDEIRQIVNRLRSSAHESTAIAGERRIGKTSLLKYLSNPNVAVQLGLERESFCLVYIDFQGLTDITPQRFWKRVMKKMIRTICHEELKTEIKAFLELEDFDFFNLEDLFESIMDTGLNTVLLLDEFEYITQNPNFKVDFFSGLRALAIHANMPLIPATRRDLVDLCHSAEIKGSPFFNIFANVNLRPFKNGEVQEMLEAYIAQSGLKFSPEEKSFIIRLGGNHPFFVQMAGYYAAECKLECLPDETFEQTVARKFDQQAEPHFNYLWSHSPESEKITLVAVMTLNQQKPTAKTIPNLENLTRFHPRAELDVPTLLRRGMLLEKDGVYTTLSPSLERWIAREIKAAPDEEAPKDSVEAWMKAGGAEKSSSMKSMLPKFKEKYWPLISNVAHELSFELAGAVVFELLTKALL